MSIPPRKVRASAGRMSQEIAKKGTRAAHPLLRHRRELGLSFVLAMVLAPGATASPSDKWTRIGAVVSASQPWEGTGVLEPSVLWDARSGWRMWYSGNWYDSAIGLATSTDGVSWAKYPANPVFGQGGSGFTGGVVEPYVLDRGSGLYLYASSPFPARSTTIVASSTDGIAWTELVASVPMPAGETEFGNRVVWSEGSTWHMLQEAGLADGFWKTYLMASDDGLSWTLANEGQPLVSLQPALGWMYGGPKFASVDGAVTPRDAEGRYHVWYHAGPETPTAVITDIYEATSTDLIAWTVDPRPALTHLGSGWEVEQVAGPSPVSVGGRSYLFFDGDDNATFTSRIGVAVSR